MTILSLRFPSGWVRLRTASAFLEGGHPSGWSRALHAILWPPHSPHGGDSRSICSCPSGRAEPLIALVFPSRGGHVSPDLSFSLKEGTRSFQLCTFHQGKECHPQPSLSFREGTWSPITCSFLLRGGHRAPNTRLPHRGHEHPQPVLHPQGGHMTIHCLLLPPAGRAWPPIAGTFPQEGYRAPNLHVPFGDTMSILTLHFPLREGTLLPRTHDFSEERHMAPQSLFSSQ